jgi:hypothetical protein
MKILKYTLVLSLIFCCFLATAQNPHADSGLKKVIVKEVLQVSSYTYLRVLEEDETEKWLAVPTMEARPEEVYYYQGGVEMPDFESSELKRKFDVVLFLGYITSADTVDPEKGIIDPNAVNEEAKPSKKATLEKLELSIDDIESGVRIAQLFENSQNYAGKKIKVKGEVTKFTSKIMGKNWVHFQDGTSFDGAYDLMITTQENLSVGDVVVFEGVIALDKNFGAGYFYKVILEEAVVVK